MRRERVDAGLDSSREPAPPAEVSGGPAVDRVLQLQGSAGNAAVTGLLQRDGLSMRNPPSLVPSLAGGLPPNLRLDPGYVARQQEEIKKKIVTYLDAEKPKVQ